MNLYLAVFLGGGLGSMARFAVSSKITSRFTGINPVGTLTANIIATILLGIVLYIAAKNSNLSNTVRVLLISGFCGGFSTFSTFSWETWELMRTGNYFYAGASVLVSILLGVGVLFILAKFVSI